MRKIAVITWLLCVVAIPAEQRNGPPPKPLPIGWPEITVYFSPRGGCTEAIVREIDNACETIRVQAYSFTSPVIAQALIEAQRRGVQVEAVLDEDSNRNPARTTGDDIAAAGATVLHDGVHAIAHNKVVIIDDAVVITGSFNFSVAAEESNAENLLVIRDRELAGKYRANYDRHRAHSAAFR